MTATETVKDNELLRDRLQANRSILNSIEETEQTLSYIEKFALEFGEDYRFVDAIDDLHERIHSLFQSATSVA